MKFKYIFLFALLGLYTTEGYSQDPAEFLGYKEQFPDARVLRLNHEAVVTLSIVKGSLDIKQEILEEHLFMNESAVHHSKKALNFSTFFELEKVEASTLIPAGKKYREVKVTDFKEKDELSGSFHDDNKTLNFIFPDLGKGARSKLRFTEKIKNPRFLTPFYFGDFYPVVNNRYTIVADKDISLSFKEFNTKGLDLHFTESTKGNNRIYSWELKNVQEYKDEIGAPTFKTVIPHIIPVITSYKSNGSKVNVLNDVNDLFNWYYSLVTDINKEEPDKQLIKLVEELVADKESNLEKVRAIYYWTQQNIKYIAFEYALGGFIPREANAVFQKKYGDCKDNSSILHKMLEIAGLEGHLTWIGTREIPYTYEEVPTPLVDNHMILAYMEGDNIYYLDATGRYLPLEYPGSFIQGKEALISLGEGKYRIAEVPVVPAAINLHKDVSHIELRGEDLKGKATTSLSGLLKVDIFHILETQKTREKTLEFYTRSLEKGSNKFLIKQFEERNKYSYEDDFEVLYEFEIAGYAKKVGDEIFVNLNLNKDIVTYKTRDDRKNAIEYDMKTTTSYEIHFEIPRGYVVNHLPGNQEIKNDLLTSSVSYEQNGNSILYKHDFITNFISLDTEQQKEVNSVIRQVEKAFKEIVILKKSENTPQ